MSSGGMTRDANLMNGKQGVLQDSLQRCPSLPALPPSSLPSSLSFLKYYSSVESELYPLSPLHRLL